LLYVVDTADDDDASMNIPTGSTVCSLQRLLLLLPVQFLLLRIPLLILVLVQVW